MGECDNLMNITNIKLKWFGHSKEKLMANIRREVLRVEEDREGISGKRAKQHDRVHGPGRTGWTGNH